MFVVDCHAVSDMGFGHHVSQDRFFIADVVPSEENAASTLSARHLHPPHSAHQTTPKADGSFHSEAGSEPLPGCVSRMFGVAHGVHGLPAGDRASEIVVETARDFVTSNLHNRPEWRPEVLSCTLTAVPGKCAKALSEDVAKNPWEKGLGSTLTLAYVIWPRLYLIHVGDCRCYLCRDSKVERLTADQIVDGTLAERGVVPADSQQSLRRRTLWSFIADNAKNLNPQVTEIDLKVGDTLVLCTSGLVQEVADERIAEVLDSDPPAKDACRRLVGAAHESGGTEDMTVIVARFRERELTGQTPPESQLTGESATELERIKQIILDAKHPQQTQSPH
jgi:serine/threonine protein phosphatase PrpC